MIYIVKHGESDWRMHAEDGTELYNGDHRPDTREMVDWLADHHNGASILANPTARSQYTDILTGETRILVDPIGDYSWQ